LNEPSPAIVAQDAVRRLPRWALLLLCLAYVVPGYVGRDPWKSADLAAFGIMRELASEASWTAWWHPSLMGLAPDTPALLPYWLGAWALQWAPAWVAPDFAARLPFLLMLAGTLAVTWYAVYDLARHPGAQPVAFAFGGEARATDYARALADGGLLALIATLGLAQFSHETTPALGQLFCSTLVFGGLAGLPFRPRAAPVALVVGLPGLVLCGAPSIALIFGGVATLGLLRPSAEHLPPALRRRAGLVLGATTLASAALAWFSGLLSWQLADPGSGWGNPRALGRLLLWFTWPAWPLVLWALWRWRRQLGQLGRQRHLGLPLLIAGVPVACTVATPAGDRALLLALPAMACLAALALPTFKRGAAALIDWFTVLFFSAWTLIIWVVWISMQTGVPAQPAANVARLAPGFQPSFQWLAFIAALAATAAWIALARWRTGRHRTALWKSLVLPAAGATLCWLLLMTLWLPALNYARGYAPQMRQVRQLVGDAPCVQVHGLSVAQVAAVRFHGSWDTVPARSLASCPWLLVDVDATASLPATVTMAHWRLVKEVHRPTTKDENLLVYRRVGGP